MSAKLLNLLPEPAVEKIKEQTVKAGCVYHVRLTKSHSINTKEKEFRDKFVIIIGSDGNSFYGVLLINTKLGFPEDEQYELKCNSYKYLTHNSFVNCSSVKHIDRKTLISGESKGELHRMTFNSLLSV